jgi:hypothetical protein
LVRARFLQEWLANIDAEDDPFRARFFVKLPEDVREAIESASRVGWLPVAYHVLLADVLDETFGPTRAHDYYRRAFAASLSGPILGPLVTTGARLLGFTPGTFARWMPRGWQITFRDVGEVEGEVTGPGMARITYRNLPAVCIASEPWLTSSQASAYGVYDRMEVAGVVRLDLSGRAAGTMRLELEWTDSVPRWPVADKDDDEERR